MKIDLTINQKKKTLEIKADETLVQALRNHGYLSVKEACMTGSCGVCTVILDEKPVLSCSYLAARAHGKSVTTIEGIGDEAKKLGGLLVDEGVDQCGYCSPGLILTVAAMKKELKNPTEEEVKHYLTGNLCRCTGYLGQLRAIMKYLEED